MKIQTFSKQQARVLLPTRDTNQNKTHGGKSLIVAGSNGFFGAAVLSATAAARAGSGYTTLMTDSKRFPVDKHPDFLTIDLLIKQNVWINFNAIAVGPGLGISTKTERIIRSLIQQKIAHVVLDADALTVVAKKKIFPLPATWILTPHTGELDRLLATKSRASEQQREELIRRAQVQYGCHILLKGPQTLVCNGSSLVAIKSGNSALAKAGTGDVLTGIICGLMAQGLSTIEAACLGAYLHGQCSQIWVKSGRDHLSLLASDLLDLLPIAIAQLRKVSCK
jgi:ADP-dependent NAD(P)H-hydrate dehydratase